MNHKTPWFHTPLKHSDLKGLSKSDLVLRLLRNDKQMGKLVAEHNSLIREHNDQGFLTAFALGNKDNGLTDAERVAFLRALVTRYCYPHKYAPMQLQDEFIVRWIVDNVEAIMDYHGPK